MTSTISPQVRMANDIAVQFEHKDADEAAEEIAAHIRMFWDPRMKSELLRLAGSEPSSFEPTALAAARRL
ncbi:formate dehydrogenase subunit delta [Prauserella cavernicola]|uniref:Formate dehydrogenase subunit delta n=1 Tax=Prauserella cavernicola TaxID=2800127 RepID=A0A934QRR7_9PSEU|nr:formate dehydrogenase subunit delta [Prauserella cavernicola]MBK1784968.1 formate dehydrogenase subunit delta [Prauserella cavernicola]